ncbi:MAG: sugar phosphate isomerase/epimerase [Clostridia bacterium]|nr:sugar phosphate isomerase/epimerase [Clostridia bacterium]
MLKIGLSTCGKVIDEALFASYREAGIECMEIATAPELYPTLDMKNIRALADRYGITLWSYHLPFMPFDRLDISRRELTDYTKKYLSELALRAGDVGIDKLVIHPSGEPVGDAERDERMKYACEALAYLASVASGVGATVAVEDLPRSCLGRNSREILTLLSADDRLRVCFDTNHLLGESNLDFIKRVGDKIITTHISDYDFVDEKHWLPGEGDVRWAELYSALIGAGYSGAWLYELGYDAPSTIARPRCLTPSDFVKNAREIFAGVSPTPIVIRR